MRSIVRSRQFKRDYKRESRGQHRDMLNELVAALLLDLANDVVLHESYRGHALSGNWKDFRDCHVKPDLVLIYQKLGDDVLKLARFGSHSELDL